MTKAELTFTFDPSDFDSMLKLMEEKGNGDTMYVGVNADFERTTISIFQEKIICETYQHNGWVRKNIYWRDGTREELFEGRR